MTMTESSLKRKFKSEAEKLGWMVNVIEQRSTTGTPDLIIGKVRNWIWIECKHWRMNSTVSDKRNVKIHPSLFTGSKVQYETMRRLASIGPAHYVVFVTDAFGFVGSALVTPWDIRDKTSLIETYPIMSNKEVLQHLENMM